MYERKERGFMNENLGSTNQFDNQNNLKQKSTGNTLPIIIIILLVVIIGLLTFILLTKKDDKTNNGGNTENNTETNVPIQTPENSTETNVADKTPSNNTQTNDKENQNNKYKLVDLTKEELELLDEIYEPISSSLPVNPNDKTDFYTYGGGSGPMGFDVYINKVESGVTGNYVSFNESIKAFDYYEMYTGGVIYDNGVSANNKETVYMFPKDRSQLSYIVLTKSGKLYICDNKCENTTKLSDLNLVTTNSKIEGVGVLSREQIFKDELETKKFIQPFYVVKIGSEYKKIVTK